MKLLLNQLMRSAQAATGFACLCLSGCASTVIPAFMVPESQTITKQFEKSIVVVANRSVHSEDNNGPKIVVSELEAALQTSIKQSGLFAHISQDDSADYRLDVEITDLQISAANFATVAKVGMLWKITRVHPTALVWRDAGNSNATIYSGNVPLRANRERVATGVAIRENIKIHLERISNLPL